MKEAIHTPSAQIHGTTHQTNRTFKRRRANEREKHENGDNNNDDVSQHHDGSIISDNVPRSLFPFSNLAILGDSTVSLIVTFLLLVIAVVFQQYTTAVTPQRSDTAAYNFIKDHRNFDATTTAAVSSSSSSSSQPSHLLKEFATYESLGPLPEEIVSEQNNKNMLDLPKIYQITDPLIVTPEMIHEYHRDGVICIRGLISHTLMQRLDDETQLSLTTKGEGVGNRMSQVTNNPRKHRSAGTQFHTVSHSALFRPNNGNETSANSKNTYGKYGANQPSALMEVALWSNVSLAAASLLQLSPPSNLNNETLRVIRDIFLAKDDDPYVCGWHVDDFGFWPAMPQQQSSLSQEGINAWIALDDMLLTEETGGFALAVQSHTAKWNDTAYNITGAPTLQNFPYQSEGYHNVSHMFQARIGYGTCNIERTAPHIHQRMEEMKRVYPVRKGDVIFHTRYLFHRTVPISSTSKKREQDPKVFRRYSIRYGMGSTTIIPPGYGTELSVLYDPKNGGLSADKICSKDQVPWYPQAYPHMQGIALDVFWKQYLSMIQHHIPVAQERLQLRKQEMRPYLRQLAQEQSSKKLFTSEAERQ